MTAQANENTSAQQANKTAEIERLTQALKSDDKDAVTVLLQRAQLWADLGSEADARNDVSRAAALTRDPKYNTPESVAAVERAFRELSFARMAEGAQNAANKKFATSTDKKIVELVTGSMTQGSKADADDVAGAIRALDMRIASNSAHAIDQAHVLALLDAFHTACEQQRPDASDSKAKITRALSECLKSAMVHLAAPSPDQEHDDEGDRAAEARKDSKVANGLLVDIAKHTAKTWESLESNGEFKQAACHYGAPMYAAAVYSLSTHVKEEKDGAFLILTQAFKFFISQLWLIGSLPASAVNEFRNVGQGALRLLTVNKPLFIHTFVAESASLSKNSRNKGAISPLERLLYILGDGGEDLGGKQPLAVLIASQLVPAAKDPANSSMFPGYNPATVRSAGALPIALTQMRSLATLILDSWVQSDIQAERSRGLLSMASLYEAGVGSDLTADLWLKNGWAEDLWDQGEFDKQETQLALLKLANESSTDVNIGKQMKKFGNGLVQALVRKGSSKGANEMGSRLADAAAIVLSKWSGAPKTAASAGSAATAVGQPDNEQGSGITELPSEPSVDDMDPLQLADIHIRRIIECTTKPGSDDAAAAAAAAVEKATEALGYLCLKPRLKEHVSQNSSLLKSLFSFAQKQPSASLKFSTSMLIRNLTQYRPVLTEEQKRMQQLQQLSRRAQQKSPGKDGDKPTTVGDELKQAEADDDGDDEEGKKLDSAEHVSKRAALLCNAGCISVLVSAVQPKQHPSDNIKDAVAEIMVALATTQTLRGLIVQQGGVRALLSIATKDAPKASSSKTAAAARSYTPQALRQQRDRNIALSLAKIAISTPPHLAFSDPREIVRLLLSLLAEESDSQAMLMRFEALLALTNLASSDPGSAYDVRGYMANDLNGIGLVEMIMLSDHPLIRRASTELVCNLIYEPSVFERYAKNADKSIPKATSDDVDAPAEVLPSGIVELASDDDGDGHGDAGLGGSDSDAYRSHRLHLLVALSDVDDAQTRSAASGALAVLSNDPGCCRYLFLAHPRAPDVLLALAQDSSVDAQMQAAFKHRVAIIWANAAGCGDSRVSRRIAQQPGVLELLEELSSNPAMPYHAASAKALELLDAAKKQGA